MSDRCWPPEELRLVDGWWLVHTASDGDQAMRWKPGLGCWFWNDAHHWPHECGSWLVVGRLLTGAEAAALRQERDAAHHTLGQVIADTAQELGCERDNEAILEAAYNLRAEVARLRTLLAEIEADAFWTRSHAALRSKITAALVAKPQPTNAPLDQSDNTSLTKV